MMSRSRDVSERPLLRLLRVQKRKKQEFPAVSFRVLLFYIYLCIC
jgi:hypothetical protein